MEVGSFDWILELVVGLFALSCANYVFKKVIKHIRKRALMGLEPGHGTRGWKEQLDTILFLPVQILLWILGTIFVCEVLGERFKFFPFETYLSAFRNTAFIMSLTWIALRWKKEAQRTLLEKYRESHAADASFAEVLSKVITVVILILSAMILLQVWGLNILPLMAFGGIGAATMGFASKDVVANFFGGLMPYITRPFMVGDLILLPEKNLEAYVEEIGWYVTSVRDRDKRPVYLPNSIFSNALLINASRRSHRRIEEKIFLRMEDFEKLADLTERIRDALSRHPAIDSHHPVVVALNSLQESTIELYIDAYSLATRYEDFLAAKQEVLSLVYRTVLEQGAQVASKALEVRSGWLPPTLPATR